MDYAGHRVDAPAPARARAREPSHSAVGAQPHYHSYQPPPSYLPPYQPPPNPNPSPAPVPVPDNKPYSTAATAPYPYHGGPAGAPYSDPRLGRSGMPSQYYSSSGGGYPTEPNSTTAAAAPSSYYYSAVGGSGGGEYGQTVAPYSDLGLGQAARPPAYYNAVGGSGGGYGQTVAPYPDPGLYRVARPPAHYNAVGGGGGENEHRFSAKDAILQYGVDPQLRGASDAIRQYGADPHLRGIPTWSSNGLVPTVQSSHTPRLQSNVAPIIMPCGAANMPSSDITWRRQKRTNPGQSVHCEVCKIDCNNKEVLVSHKQGKKHKQNLLKLQEAITAKPAGAPAAVLIDKDEGSSVSNKEKVVRERKKKKRVAMETVTVEDLEIKKKRVLEGGGAASEMKVCTICNVVVNSQQVLDCHLSGLKHAAMVKKQHGS